MKVKKTKDGKKRRVKRGRSSMTEYDIWLLMHGYGPRYQSRDLNPKDYRAHFVPGGLPGSKR